MSYITEHHCPSTLLLIHLRNARDLARTAAPHGKRLLTEELTPNTQRSVSQDIETAIAALERAIHAVEAERGSDPTPRGGRA